MCWITRRHPFGKARLIDTGEIFDFSTVTTSKDIVTIIASRPLTDDEVWHHMGRGEFAVFRDGLPQNL